MNCDIRRKLRLREWPVLALAAIYVVLFIRKVRVEHRWRTAAEEIAGAPHRVAIERYPWRWLARLVVSVSGGDRRLMRDDEEPGR